MEEKNKPIGVMDSGVGGLTVLKQMVELCPQEDYIYIGDTKNLPYGEKSKEELISIAKKIFDYFESKQVKAVIMACNTTSATVYDEFKDKYSFTIYPLIQIASKCITMDKKLTKIAVMATKATVNSHKYKQELQKNNPNVEVFEQACPMWVPIVEKNITDFDEKQVICEYLDNVLEFNPQKIILGCTHYPYLLNRIEKYAAKDLFINPARIFANYVTVDLKTNNKLKQPQNIQRKGHIEYFASSAPEDFKKNAEIFMPHTKTPELISL